MSGIKQVLDVCCNKGKMWRSKKPENYIGVDLEVMFRPTIVADAKHLPLRTGCIDMITCDPPFWIRKSPVNSHKKCSFIRMFREEKYSIWKSRFQWLKFLLGVNDEFARVLKDTGELIFKVLDHGNDDVVHLAELGYLKRFRTDNVVKNCSRGYRSKCLTCWVRMVKK